MAGVRAVRFVVILGTIATATGLRVGDVVRFKSRLRDLIPAPNTTTALGDRADVLGGLVRLGFHDAGTYDKTMPCGQRSGPDGCLPLKVNSNSGLEGILELVRELCEDLKLTTNASRADCWQLAATTAIEQAAPQDAGLAIPFYWGRYDRDDCTSTAVLLSAKGGTRGVLRMADSMDVTVAEIVALSGAHAIGRATTVNSGFPANGFDTLPWTENPGVFDNKYFQTLINTRWDLGDPALGAVFAPDRKTFLLRTDIALLYNISSGDPADEVCLPHDYDLYPPEDSAVLPHCPLQLPGSTASWVHKYANSRADFYSNFVSGWLKLVSEGYTTLVEPCPDDGPCDQPPVEPCMTPEGMLSPKDNGCTPSSLAVETSAG
eukprot:Hpha_TRINITY_DN15136_c2_g10::TRINITY_DN15136_c2_g10_i1::g.128984::m.128984